MDNHSGQKKRGFISIHSNSNKRHQSASNQSSFVSPAGSLSVLNLHNSKFSQVTSNPAIQSVYPLTSFNSSSNSSSNLIFSLPRGVTDGSISNRLKCISKLLLDNTENVHIIQAVASQIESISHLIDHSPGTESNHSRSPSIHATHDLLEQRVIPEIGFIQSKLSSIEHDVKLIKKSQISSLSTVLPKQPKPPDISQSIHRNDVDNLAIIEKANYQNSRYKPIDIRKYLIGHNLITNGSAKVDFINLHINGNIYIHCHSVKSRDIVLNIISTELKLSTRAVKKPSALFMFSSLPSDTSFDKLISWLEDSDSRFRKGAANPYSNEKNPNIGYIPFNASKKGIVLEVDSELSKSLLSEPTANFEDSLLSVTPYTPLIQCNKCGRFGHKSSNCRFTKACPSCASTDSDHHWNQCEVRYNSDPSLKNCSNCKRLKLPSIGHCAWECSCPHRRAYIKQLKSLYKPLDHG